MATTLPRLARSCAAAFLCFAFAVPASFAAFLMDVRPGYGVTRMRWLSDYNERLRGTEYDTPVYVLEGAGSGAAALVMGGTHPREIAGVVAATLIVENARVRQGTLFVVPCLNAAGMSVADTLGNRPHLIAVEGRSGRRFLSYGDRYVPLGPGERDPERFVHPSGFVLKDGREWRNVNRNYPGVADGSPAQRIAFAVMELIRRERVRFCLDMHEARTFEESLDRETGKVAKNSLLANSLIAHPDAVELGAEALFLLEDRGIGLKLDQSAPGYRGLSHYEIGEGTECLAFLSETPNPAMNAGSEDPDPLGLKRFPIEERVGVALELFSALCSVYSSNFDAPLVVDGLPSKAGLEREGLKGWLN